MRTLLIGSGGQLGSDILRTWAGEISAFSHKELDVCNRVQVVTVIKRERPELVINTAAYHRVDDIEETFDQAFAVNAIGAKHVADATRMIDAAVIWISTDYVFDGDKGSAYAEDDLPRPINAYGASKLAGELLVRQSNPKHFVVRSSSLFGVAGASGKGGNFVETMIRKARAGDDLRVVDDQVSSPTCTLDLALKLHELSETDRYGLYHVTNSGQTSWHGFAAKIFELTGLQPNLTAISSGEINSAARRPRFSVLENRALQAAGVAQARPWHEALAAYLGEKGHLSGTEAPAASSTA